MGSQGLFFHMDSEHSDQTGQMVRLIQVFAGCKHYFAGFVVLRLSDIVLPYSSTEGQAAFREFVTCLRLAALTREENDCTATKIVEIIDNDYQKFSLFKRDTDIAACIGGNNSLITLSLREKSIGAENWTLNFIFWLVRALFALSILTKLHDHIIERLHENMYAMRWLRFYQIDVSEYVLFSNPSFEYSWAKTSYMLHQCTCTWNR